jgi:pimeloyl-ACP methyl ester carboxylesterase
MPSLPLAERATVAYGDAGAGAPLVLVHGSPAEGRAWGRVARHLQGFRILTPDLPGYGGSDPLPNGTGTAGMAGAVVAVIDVAAREAGAVWLAGHSYGGNVALHAALARRERIAGLVLFEPVFFRGLALAGEHAVLAAAQAHFGDYVRRVENGEHGAVSRMIDFWFGAGAFTGLPPTVQAYLAKSASRNAVDVKAALSETVAAADLTAFSPPTLVAYGARSPPTVPAIAAALARLLPRAETEAIPGATHAMLDTHPEAVARLIGRVARGKAGA